MTEIDLPHPPVISPKIKIDPATRLHLLTDREEEAQVIVHCTFVAPNETSLIRIWQTTFLFAHNSPHRSRLLHVENISIFPAWTSVNANEVKKFTLIFSSLPKNCKAFDLIEKIPQSGGFEVSNIPRNERDVYEVSIQ
jgi:hypothetical protein